MDAPAPIRLRGGQRHHAHLPAGTLIIACAGRLSVTDAPRWLGDQVFQVHHRLAEGDVLRIEAGGWIAVSADGDASFVCTPPPGLTLRLHDGAAQLEAWFVQTWRAQVESPLALLRARLRWLQTLQRRRLRVEVSALRARLER